MLAPASPDVVCPPGNPVLSRSWFIGKNGKGLRRGGNELRDCPGVIAKLESMYPEAAAFKWTRPPESGDPARNSKGQSCSGFALVHGLFGGGRRSGFGPEEAELIGVVLHLLIDADA